MHDRLHHHDHPPRRRQFSLAQQGVGVRLALALMMAGLIWATILPLVAA